MTTPFETLGLRTPLLKSIEELGFETPTAIQAKAIPQLLEGAGDMMALSQTGTGKTAAFGLPLLSLLDFSLKTTQALILCPTRELCIQISRDLQQYAKYLPEVHVVPIYGGAGIRGQILEVQKGAHIIVGTPGRMIDMIQRKKLKLSTVEYVVLDEADEMLNMGFKEDLDTILSETPEDKNTWLFSATMPDEVLRISRDYMENPLQVTVGTKNSGNENIEHVYYAIRQRDRYAALKRIADFNQDIYAIVFCRTKVETQYVADCLIKDGYSADALHGDLSQAQRDQVMKRFRSRMVQMLVATDVAARGIDVNDVTHVINYNLPDELENYTHRSGRTARAGKTGISIALAGPQDSGKIRMIERIIRQKFQKGKLPSVDEVHQKRLFHIVKQVKEAEVDQKRLAEVLPQIKEQLEHLSKDELISRFVSMEFNRLPEINTTSVDDVAMKTYQDFSGQHYVKLYVSLGKFDGLDKRSIIGLVSDFSGIAEDEITITEIKNSFSFVKIRPDQVNAFVAGCKNKVYNNRPVRVEMRYEGAGDASSLKERKFRSRSESGYTHERKKYQGDRNRNTFKRSRRGTYSK